MAEYVFQLTSSNTNTTALTVTLPVPLKLLQAVELLDTGNYPNASAVPPVTCTVVTTSPTAADQVQLAGPTTLQFGSGTTLDTSYGSIVVRGLGYGQFLAAV